MTTTQAPQTFTNHEPATLPTAVGTFLATCAFTSLGTVASPRSGDEHGWGEFLVVCGIGLVATVVVLGLVVPRVRNGSRAGGVGLALGIIAVPSVLAFWAGITPALAVGAVLLGLAARRQGRGGMGSTAVALGLLAGAGYVAIYVGDWVSQL